MRAVIDTSPGQVELNWMWLPTWIGMNAHLKEEIEKELKEKLVGETLDDTTLDWAHDLVVTFLEHKFPFEGLRDHLDGLKSIVL